MGSIAVSDGTDQAAYVVGPTINAKAAALFFRYVVPVVCGTHIEEVSPPFMKGDRFWHWPMEDGILGAMYEHGHKSLIAEEHHIITYDTHPVYGSYVIKPGCQDAVGFALLDMLQADTHVFEPGASAMGSVLSNKDKVSIREVIFGMNAMPLKCPLYGCDLLGRSDKDVNAVLITLANVPWVDLTNAEWTQILEFRKDDDSLKKFRNFRLFISNAYARKDRQFIEDDFLKRLDEFKAARVKHGFMLQNSTIKSVVKSKYILTGGLAGLLAWLFGTSHSADLVGSAALFAGVTAEIADTLLDIRAANFDLNHQIAGHELAYVIKARDSLGSAGLR